MTHPLILASKSASRKALMSGAGLRYESVSAEIDEREVEEPLIQQGASPAQVAKALAAAKAIWVSERFPDAYVVGSDQILSLGERIYHKPGSMEEAADNIRTFSGKTHCLNCGVAIARQGAIVWSGISIAEMTMRPITEEFLEYYMGEAGEGILLSVGAYHFEGLGIQLFEKIHGDYFTILGLPMLTLLDGLRSLGAING